MRNLNPKRRDNDDEKFPERRVTMTSPAKSTRSYPPDYVSAETLAHRLDCSKSTVAEYVRRGLLPKPLKIGELVRWHWANVEKFIAELENSPAEADAADPYLDGIDRGATEKARH